MEQLTEDRMHHIRT